MSFLNISMLIWVRATCISKSVTMYLNKYYFSNTIYLNFLLKNMYVNNISKSLFFCWFICLSIFSKSISLNSFLTTKIQLVQKLIILNFNGFFLNIDHCVFLCRSFTGVGRCRYQKKHSCLPISNSAWSLLSFNLQNNFCRYFFLL